MIDDVSGIRFHALRNALYHTARRRDLETYDRYANFAIVILGSASAADVLSGWHIQSSWVALATAAVGALQLVFGFGQRARTHELLQRQYYDLLAQVLEVRDPPDEDICKWAGVLGRIAGEEPPTMLLAQALAYNAACSTLGHAQEDLLVIPWWLRCSGWLIPFEGIRLNRFSES